MSTISRGSSTTGSLFFLIRQKLRAFASWFDLGKGTPFVALLTVIALAMCAYEIPRLEGSLWTVVFFISLNCLAAAMPVNLYRETYVTASLVVTIPLIALYGAPGAALAAPLQAVAGAMGLAVLMPQKRSRRMAVRAMLSSAAIATIVLVCSALAYSFFVEIGSTSVEPLTIIAVAAATISWFGINVLLLSLSRSASGRGTFRATVMQHLWLLPHTSAMGGMGMVLIASYDALGGLGVLAFATPAVMMRLVMKQYTDKTEDNVLQLKEQNEQLKIASLELQNSYDQIQYLALHDAPTSLPNRTSLIEAAAKDPTGEPTLYLAIGIDRLSEVAQAFGLRYADDALRDMASRLGEELSRKDVTIARIGEDRLGMYLRWAGDRIEAHELAATVLSICSRPISSDRHLSLGPRIGMVFDPSAAALDAETMLRRAEMALQDARHNDMQISGYTVDMDEERRERLLLLGDLQQAIDTDQFWLAYQPQVDILSGRTLAVEALMRWKHPVRGNIPPVVFIPLAESAGFIRDLTDWAAHTAAAQQREWRNNGLRMSVSINVSAHDLRDENFASVMQQILWSENVMGKDFVFEVTESALVSNGRVAIEALRELNTLGSHNAIDDFGTGYSSLAYLRDLPVQELKIDRAFVMDLVHDTKAEAILRTITQLGADLGMNIVTEGIEDLETLKLAVKAGCRTAQGYYFSRPQPADELVHWLKSAPTKALAA